MHWTFFRTLFSLFAWIEFGLVPKDINPLVPLSKTIGSQIPCSSDSESTLYISASFSHHHCFSSSKFVYFWEYFHRFIPFPSRPHWCRYNFRSFLLWFLFLPSFASSSSYTHTHTITHTFIFGNICKPAHSHPLCSCEHSWYFGHLVSHLFYLLTYNYFSSTLLQPPTSMVT